ncbi:MAG: glycoside hydrolase family 88 protein [Bacteroidales bacterium]|nr:glycoside hydrolase family 88 protein [Bacteroidales bacterium]
MKKSILIIILLISYFTVYSQEQIIPSFQADLNKADIKTVLKAVADWQVRTPLTLALPEWGNATLYAGMVDWAGIAGNDSYYEWLKGIGEKCSWTYFIHHDNLTRGYNADDYCVGQTYIELYRKYKDKKMIEPIRAYLDHILLYPPVGGLKFVRFSSQRWTWIDALFMAPGVWAKMATETGSKKYLDFMFQEYKASTEFLYDTEEHLWFEDSNWFDTKEANGAKVFWGRGNGWVFAGLPIILKELPAKYENKNYFVTIYKEMAAKLITLQSADGYWSTSLLDPASYPTPEMSGTAFFVYGLAYGVNNGYLDKETYLPAIVKGWESMVASVWPDGKVGFIQPRGKGPKPVTSEMTEVYGVGGFLMAGTEIYKMIEKGIL